MIRTSRAFCRAGLIALAAFAVACDSPSNPAAPQPPGAAVTLASLALDAETITAGETLEGTVTLTGAAPAGGVTVTLAADDPSASVPASLTVAAGATNGTFTIATSAVTIDTDATITATLSGASRTAALRVMPEPGVDPDGDGPIASIAAQHNDVIGGDKTTGMVTLRAPAPAGGVRLSLSSDDADVSVPSGLTIAAGATTGTFEIATEPVTAEKTARITVTVAAGARAARRAATAAASAVLTVTLLPEPAPETPAAPTLTGISPASGLQGASVDVTLTGTNFIDGATVAVSGAGLTVSAISVDSATIIAATFAIDAGAATGARDVTVTTASGTTDAVSFTIGNPAPTLTGLSPTSGIQGASVDVTLTGTAFIDGATVAISGSGVTVSDISVDNATTITATLAIAGGAATGARDVTVTTAGGTTGAQTFTVNAAAPTLTNISPDEGDRADTVAVTLTGTHFIDGDTTVAVSGADVTVSNVNVASSTSLTADVAIGGTTALGARNVTVTTPGGTSGAVSFTITQPSDTATFNYTGAQQDFVVPDGVTSVTIEASGAQGGAGGTADGGAGAHGGTVTATIDVTPGETLAVFVGGQGGAGGTNDSQPGPAGSNSGGGAEGGAGGDPSGGAGDGGGGGGGASDVRQGGTALADRVVVAGGGGGGGGADFDDGGAGGAGGDTTAAAGAAGTGLGPGAGGGGGTQAAGGVGGDGGGGDDGAAGESGSGGAGGNGEEASGGGGGGGGSSFATGSATSVTHQQGARAGHGVVIIRW